MILPLVIDNDLRAASITFVALRKLYLNCLCHSNADSCPAITDWLLPTLQTNMSISPEQLMAFEITFLAISGSLTSPSAR